MHDKSGSCTYWYEYQQQTHTHVHTTSPLTDNGRLKINKDRPRYVLAGVCLLKERTERRVTVFARHRRIVVDHEAVSFDAVLEAVELPAAVADLDAGLADVDAETFALEAETAADVGL